MNTQDHNARKSFINAYIEAALWSSVDYSDGEPLDAVHTQDDIAPETIKQMQVECNDFMDSNDELLEDIPASSAGHDFWLTRNHHGAGFWDRGYPKKIGNALTEAAHFYSEYNLYIGDDGFIYGQ